MLGGVSHSTCRAAGAQLAAPAAWPRACSPRVRVRGRRRAQHQRHAGFRLSACERTASSHAPDDQLLHYSFCASGAGDRAQSVPQSADGDSSSHASRATVRVRRAREVSASRDPGARRGRPSRVVHRVRERPVCKSPHRTAGGRAAPRRDDFERLAQADREPYPAASIRT